MACGREVVDIVCAAVLSCNYMLDVMHEFAIVLVKPAIFAPLSGSLCANRRVPASNISERSGQGAGAL
jgi:hypothetical protein